MAYHLLLIVVYSRLILARCCGNDNEDNTESNQSLIENQDVSLDWLSGNKPHAIKRSSSFSSRKSTADWHGFLRHRFIDELPLLQLRWRTVLVVSCLLIPIMFLCFAMLPPLWDVELSYYFPLKAKNSIAYIPWFLWFIKPSFAIS